METTTTATSKEQSDAQAMTLPAATSEVSGGALSPSLLLPGLPAPGTGVEMTACSSSIVPQKNPRPTSPPPTPPPPAVHETALLSNSMYTTLGATARISSVAAGTLQHQSMFCHHHRCSGLAVFTYEGDARAIYCCDHMPISPEDAHNQPCYTQGCTRRVSHGWANNASSSSTGEGGANGNGVVMSCLLHAQQGMTQMRGVACEFPGCQINPSYALKGEGQGRCCQKHKGAAMVFIDSRCCDIPTCPRTALWKESVYGQRRVCQDHREKGVAYSQLTAICAETDCFEEPCFGMASTGQPVLCAKHKAEGMTEVRPRSCMVPGCGKIPSYGVDGKREVCRDHKAQGMTYAVLTCESPHCNKNPSFAPRGETRRRFCKRHAEPHMVNVYYKYCDVGQCPERAFFESGEKLRCLQHIEPGMKPRNNICQVLGGGCTRQSSYGPDGGKPVVCTIHKQPGMVQVRTKKCKHPGCEKIPSYGYPCMSREFCKPHALEGMVYSAGSRCRFRGCRDVGTFNFPGVRGGSFCEKHREEGMVDIQPKQCEESGCKYAASFGEMQDKRARFCARHKLLGMLNIHEMWRAGGGAAAQSSAVKGDTRLESSPVDKYMSPEPSSVVTDAGSLQQFSNPVSYVGTTVPCMVTPDAEGAAGDIVASMGNLDGWAGDSSEREAGKSSPADAAALDAARGSGTNTSETIMVSAGLPGQIGPTTPTKEPSLAPDAVGVAHATAATAAAAVAAPGVMLSSASGTMPSVQDGAHTVNALAPAAVATSAGAAPLFTPDSKRPGPTTIPTTRNTRVNKRARKEPPAADSSSRPSSSVPGHGLPPDNVVGGATSLSSPSLTSLSPYAPILASNSHGGGGGGGTGGVPSFGYSGLGTPGPHGNTNAQHWNWLVANIAGASIAAANNLLRGQLWADVPRSASLQLPTTPAPPPPSQPRPEPSLPPSGDLESLAAAAASFASGARPPNYGGNLNTTGGSRATAAVGGLDNRTVRYSKCGVGGAIAAAPAPDVFDTTRPDQRSTAASELETTATQGDSGESGGASNQSQIEEQSFLSSLLGTMDPADPKTARVRGAMQARLNSIARAT